MDLLTILFSLCFPMLAGHDLLDQIPSDVYWKSNRITLSGESMLSQLSVEETKVDTTGLIEQLGDADFAKREAATQALIRAGHDVAEQVQAATQSEDPEISARAKRIAKHFQQGERDGQNRRLMAIRALGELKYQPALPKLRTIAAKEKGEYARYARRAVLLIEASLNGDGAVPKIFTQNPLVPSAEELTADIHLLPASSIGVAQVALPQRVTMPVDAVINFQPLFGRGIPRSQREPVYFTKLIRLASEIGNVRIDSATCSFSYNGNHRETFVTCVLRGHYQWELMKPLLLKEGFRSETIAGQEIVTLGDKIILIPFSDQRLVAIVGELLEQVLVKEIIVGGNAPGLIRKNEKLMNLLGEVNQRQPAWAVMFSPAEFSNTPWLAGMSAATLEITQQGPAFQLNMLAKADDPAKIDPTLKAFEKSLEHAQNEAEQLATIIPAVHPLAEIFVSIKTKKLPNGAQLTAETPDLGRLLALPLILTSNDWIK